jgi:hypothetical protein
MQSRICIVGLGEYGWSFMLITSQNIGLLHGIPSVPCEGGHLVLNLQAGPHLTTLPNPRVQAMGRKSLHPLVFKLATYARFSEFQRKY